MPYYCTVPRCTSMAGKAKNVSFHQFPRDEELAKLWNRILKRGKPYTKYSKVCSLHFKPEDYTITSVGKNKGQWRTLRKDAIPSQNLPSESPAPYTRRSSGCWVPSQPTLADPLVQQQMAQAIYMQTMLAMQTAGAPESVGATESPQTPQSTKPSPSSSSLSEIELHLRRDADTPKELTYKCHECSKCFKDPDVFLLHKRTHKKDATLNTEKENYSANIQDREETLRANPILANLLKTSMRLEPESNMANILTVENQIMAALASNMEAYIRTLSSMMTTQNNAETGENEDGTSDFEDDAIADEGDDKEISTEDKCDDDMYEDDMSVDTHDRPIDDSQNVHTDKNEDEVMQDENEAIHTNFRSQMPGENRIESSTTENLCASKVGSIEDENETHDTQFDENQSIEGDDRSINDNAIVINEASNEKPNHKLNSNSTDSLRDIYAAIIHDNFDFAHSNQINNESVDNDTNVNENHIYTAGDRITNFIAIEEAKNDTLENINHKFASDAIDNDLADDISDDNDGKLVGNTICDSAVGTVELISVDASFET